MIRGENDIASYEAFRHSYGFLIDNPSDCLQDFGYGHGNAKGVEELYSRLGFRISSVA